jgi:ankyrin repeat protein
MENEMMDAVRNGDTKNLELLLEQGSDPNFEDRWGTALGNASVKGRRDIYELLLYWGADPNLKNQFGSTALMDASQSGHTDIVRLLLLDWGADPNIRTNAGTTVLMVSSKSGNTDIIKLLLDRGIDINIENIYGQTALMWASTWGNTDIVRLLLEKGANPFIKDSDGETALTQAIDNGNTSIVTLLMRYMTTIRMQSLQRGKMTRRKLRTSMAQKRSRLSQIGDRYDLGDDVIRMINSRMTRPNRTDMIDEIPRNMTRTNR